MERVYLEFREGTSDKFYRIIAVENQGQWITTVWWGRRGSTGQTQLKYEGPSQAAAIITMNDIAYQKRSKGYHDALDPLSPAATSAPAIPVHPTTTIVASMPIGVGYATSPAGVPRFPAMKAKEVEIDWGSLDDIVMEEKFDGHRAGLTFNPDGTIVIRNVYGEDKGKIENAPHIKEHLRELELNCTDVLADGTLIDGELVGLTLEETGHLLGGSGRTDPRLRFVAFDLPFLAGDDLRDESWLVRRHNLENLLDNIGPGPVSIADILVPTEKNVQAIWDVGGEGAILKPVYSKYVPGGRADWVKIKEHHTAEAWIGGWAPGKGKYNNQIGAVKLWQFRGGHHVEVTQVSGMTDAVRADMQQNYQKDWHGRVIEFEYQKKTADSYRHPRYVRTRDDKKQTDCTWEASA